MYVASSRLSHAGSTVQRWICNIDAPIQGIRRRREPHGQGGTQAASLSIAQKMAHLLRKNQRLATLTSCLFATSSFSEQQRSKNARCSSKRTGYAAYKRQEWNVNQHAGLRASLPTSRAGGFSAGWGFGHFGGSCASWAALMMALCNACPYSFSLYRGQRTRKQQ